MFDLIIIGGAAAGSSAAIYAARRKINFKMVALDLGGEMALCGEINNWLGEPSIRGFELVKKFNDQVKSYNVDIDEGWRVEKIIPKEKYHVIIAKNLANEEKIYEAKAVIIASGIHPKHLGVPGENKFYQKGLTYCTVCDGPLFKNKTTVTIGSGNAALESALMMANIAKKVYLISKYTNTRENNYGFPKGENILIDKINTLPNVQIIYGSKTEEIQGEDRVSGIRYKDENGDLQDLAVEGVMVHAGQIPNSQFIDCVEKTKTGEIIIDLKCRTNCPGIFAAGDVSNIPYKQIGISVGQGIIAALSAIEYINRWSE